MMAPNDLTGLLAPLIALQRLLARFDDRGMVIGGVAASLLGKPRLTADVDAVMLVSTDDLPRLIEAVERSVLYPLGEVAIRLPTPEDLIIFKAVAHRPKDLLDIQAIIAGHPTLDRERIR